MWTASTFSLCVSLQAEVTQFLESEPRRQFGTLGHWPQVPQAGEDLVHFLLIPKVAQSIAEKRTPRGLEWGMRRAQCPGHQHAQVLQAHLPAPTRPGHPPP